MKIHRFIGPWQLGQGTMRIDDADLAHQLRSVLKLAPGETVVIGDGSGREAHCRIVRFDHDAVILEGLSVGENPSEPALKVTMYCAVLKAENFELAAQKATEIGVARIVPVVTNRTVKLNVRPDRVRKVVREAAELAGRGIVPDVADIVDLDAVWTDASKNDVNYFFDPSGGGFSPSPRSSRTAGLFIGPEGGWDASELDTANGLGMRITSLGTLTLSAPTAAVVATYLVVHGAEL
ncbi:MAG TPA: RsmE family RNA methyltransferase [Candidatus Paceibacterota bacterium]|nr:RsmE family RNA methyltransferase [Candidatus Paceibacterota bacterium]